VKILFLTSAHNSLSQRLLIELADRGHQVVVGLATSNEAMLKSVDESAPDLIVSPMLKVAMEMNCPGILPPRSARIPIRS
jgi:putative two-component system hydrogenase maturation factor HypX/HoxX